MTRTDVHRPSVINPADYRFVGFDYTDNMFENAVWRQVIKAFRDRTGASFSQHEHGGSCHICGAQAVYTAVFHHVPTNTLIRTGLDCTDKLDSYIDGSKFRKQVRLAREQYAGKRKAQALLTDHGCSEAWALYENRNSPQPTGHSEELTVIDIVDKLVKYGSLSEKQWGFLGSLLRRIAERPAREAQRAAEAAAAAPVPVSDSRVRIEGEVVSVKSVTTGFGDATKMLVKHADGFKVWGTVPSQHVGNIQRGDRVSFEAKVKPSKDDPKFGFFSRPTKLEVLTHA